MGERAGGERGYGRKIEHGKGGSDDKRKVHTCDQPYALGQRV
jgi:hypothetical protein